MKFSIVFALALASTSTFTLRDNEIASDNIIKVPAAGPEERITNGQDAAAGQFPYQVFLLSRRTYFYSWCGGSLISNQWVLTAAHCTDDVFLVTVYLGATLLTSPDVTYNVTEKDIIIHSGFDLTNFENDISLIKIPLTTFSDKIQPVKLPSIANSYSTYAGETVIAAGWGKYTDADVKPTINLKWAPFYVITNSVCERTIDKKILLSHICIGTTDRVSPCQGDSGGPLVLESSLLQIGLTSFGNITGCELGYPVVFTRITSHLEWIAANTGISN